MSSAAFAFVLVLVWDARMDCAVEVTFRFSNRLLDIMGYPWGDDNAVLFLGG